MPARDPDRGQHRRGRRGRPVRRRRRHRRRGQHREAARAGGGARRDPPRRDDHALVGNAVVLEPLEPFSRQGQASRCAGARSTRSSGAEALPRAARRAAGRPRARARHAAGTRTRGPSISLPRLVTVVGRRGSVSRGWPRAARGVASEARVLVGPCLPYGDGITFWPVQGDPSERFLRGDTRGDLLARPQTARGIRRRGGRSSSASRTSIGGSRPSSISCST